jgi:hypothetical protein
MYCCQFHHARGSENRAIGLHASSNNLFEQQALTPKPRKSRVVLERLSMSALGQKRPFADISN